MYCSIQEAAAILGVSRPTVYRMIETGDLKREVMLGRPALRLSEVKKVAQKSADGKASRPRKAKS